MEPWGTELTLLEELPIKGLRDKKSEREKSHEKRDKRDSGFLAGALGKKDRAFFQVFAKKI